MENEEWSLHHTKIPATHHHDAWQDVRTFMSN